MHPQFGTVFLQSPHSEFSSRQSEQEKVQQGTKHTIVRKRISVDLCIETQCHTLQHGKSKKCPCCLARTRRTTGHACTIEIPLHQSDNCFMSEHNILHSYQWFLLPPASKLRLLDPLPYSHTFSHSRSNLKIESFTGYTSKNNQGMFNRWCFLAIFHHRKKYQKMPTSRK